MASTFPVAWYLPPLDFSPGRILPPYKHRSLIDIDKCICLRYTFSMIVNSIMTGCTGFEWNRGNLLKNWEKHRVSAPECEQVFFNKPLITGSDEKHSQKEVRFYTLGQTDAGRPLFVVFTVRENLIRVISARDINKKERKVYSET